jgi:hypothetical protein
MIALRVVIADVGRNSDLLLTNRPIEVRTLHDLEISIIDTDQVRKNPITMSKRLGSRVAEPVRATFSV